MASSGTRTLKIKFDGDSTGLASASKQAGDTLERFNSTTEDTRAGLDRVGEGSENLADSSSLATGALGALASGFELVGLEKYATALTSASMATDFMSGVGDSLTLVTQKLGLATLKTKVATIGKTAATKAATVATKAQTVAQRALNLAMRMNPLGLVVTAIVGLVAVLVIAYKKSETFKRIVDGAFRAVKRAAEAVWNWLKDNWKTLLAVLTGPFGLAVLAVAKNWDKIKDGAGAAKDWVVRKMDGLVGFFTNLPDRLKRAAGGAFDGLKDAFKSAINWIIGGWNDLSFKLPEVDTHIPGVGTIGGWSLDTPNIGYLARGGRAMPGHAYLVGERGPELLTMGPTSAWVTPNHDLAGNTEVRVFIGDQELRGLVRTEISRKDRGLKRRVLAGTGGAR